MLTASLDSAYKSIFQDPDWVLKTSVGSLINLFAFLAFAINPALLPLTFLLLGVSSGYMLRVMRWTITGQYTPAINGEEERKATLPPWADFVDLTISGLSWLSIAFGFYFFALSCLLVSLVAAAALGVHQVQNAGSLVWAQSTFQFLYWLVIGQHFFLAVLMLNFAEEERMAAGFAWRKTMRRILKAPYLLGSTWLAGSTLTAAAIIIPSMTLIGSMIAPFLCYLAQLISARLLACAWAQINAAEAE